MVHDMLKPSWNERSNLQHDACMVLLRLQERRCMQSQKSTGPQGLGPWLT